VASKKSDVVAAPQDVPAILTTVERSKYLARVKASLAKTWSLSRAESISGATQLAWYLIALGRNEEARELVEVIASGAAVPSAATDRAIALAARFARHAGDDARLDSLSARLRGSGASAPSGSSAATGLADAEKDVRSAEVDPSQKHACQGFAQGCARAAYVREAAGNDLDAGANEAVERIIAQGLDGLRAQLGR
jgi:hypothetical protein